MRISEKTRYMIGLFLLLLAVFLIVYGCAVGEARIVLRKAVNICMECIGIG